MRFLGCCCFGYRSGPRERDYCPQVSLIERLNSSLDRTNIIAFVSVEPGDDYFSRPLCFGPALLASLIRPEQSAVSLSAEGRVSGIA